MDTSLHPQQQLAAGVQAILVLVIKDVLKPVDDILVNLEYTTPIDLAIGHQLAVQVGQQTVTVYVTDILPSDENTEDSPTKPTVIVRAHFEAGLGFGDDLPEPWKWKQHERRSGLTDRRGSTADRRQLTTP